MLYTVLVIMTLFLRDSHQEKAFTKGSHIELQLNEKTHIFTHFYRNVWITGAPQASLAHLTRLFSYMIQQRMFVKRHRCGHQSQRATFQRLIAPIKNTRCCHDLSKHFLQDCRERRLSRSGVGVVKITKVSSGVFVCQKPSGTTRII